MRFGGSWAVWLLNVALNQTFTSNADAFELPKS